MATAAGTSKSLLDLVQCDLCLERYNDSDRLPKLLHCSHTFCLACVERYYESKLNKKLQCPNCRKDFTVPRGGIQNLSTNIMVVNLLDHLAPFTAVDTDDGIAEASAAPEEKTTQESKPNICSLHSGQKCDFYCDDCKDPLCADCMVNVNKGAHKSHTIRKLVDVLNSFNTQRKETAELVMEMKREGKNRTKELLEELVLSRDSLMKEAKSKCYEAHKEANRWYQNTTATISHVYENAHAQILQFASKADLQELQLSLEKIGLWQVEGNLKDAKNSLDELQKSVTVWKDSAVWPTKQWSVEDGKISDEFNIDLGCITEPTLKLPDVNNFPYTIDLTDRSNGADKPTGSKQEMKQPGFRRLSDLQTYFSCATVVLGTNEVVVCLKDDLNQSTCIIKKITFKRNKIIDLYQKTLPGSFECKKYILNNNYVLLRDSRRGPSYILNSQLELISTIQEAYGSIIDAESIHCVAFLKDGTIQIYDLEQEQMLQKLTLPAGMKSWDIVSIFRHPDSQVKAVIHHPIGHKYNLSIYDRNGCYLYTNNLQFDSFLLDVPTSCNRRHLYMVSNHFQLNRPIVSCVFVFTWTGQLVTRLDTQQLGIPDRQSIKDIAVGEEEFTIVVGSGQSVSSFITFQCV